jgi:hypothetical protein
MDPIVANELRSRLDRWDREKRVLGWVGLAIVLATAGVLVHSTRFGRKSKVIEAQEFVMRDSEGRVRARLGLHPDGSPHLALFDTNGRHQALLVGMRDETASLSLFEQGHVRLVAEAEGDAHSAVRLFDRDHRVATGLYLGSDSATGLSLRSGDREAGWVLKPGGLEVVERDSSAARPSSGSGLSPRSTVVDRPRPMPVKPAPHAARETSTGILSVVRRQCT